MKLREMLVVALLASLVGVSHGASAQGAGAGGSQRLLRGVCVLWFNSGGDGAALVAQTSRYGFNARYSGGKVIALDPPAQLSTQGFTSVSFSSEGGPARCGIVVEESGQDRTAEVTADLDAWAAQHEPKWSWTKTSATPKGGALQTWETATHVMTLSRVQDVFNAGGPGNASVFVEIARKPD